MPTTLVWMNTAGPWIERSTWLSAAKCTIARGRCLANSGFHQLGIGDVALHEVMSRVAFQPREVREVAGVSEKVEVDHRLVAPGQPVEDEVGADEAGAAGHENHLSPLPSSMSFKYLWKVLQQPITTCAKPGPPSRNPRRRK